MKEETSVLTVCFVASIRAVRVLTFNARWASKLEKKKQRQQAKDVRLREMQERKENREKEADAKRKVNPFSTAAPKGEGLGGGLFGGAANPFAVSAVPEQSVSQQVDLPADTIVSEDDAEENSDDDMAEEMAIKASLQSRPLQDHDWSKDAPAYHPAHYLTTYSEPSSSARAYEESKELKKELKQLKESGGITGMQGWESEKYESMMISGMDETFERFVKRVSPNGKQVVRYEFGGVPLPFHAKGAAYEKLWPSVKPTSTTVSGAAFKDLSRRNAPREYSTDGVSRCPLCGSKRIFEVQLMPNLVNSLRVDQIVGGGHERDDDERIHDEEDAEKRKKREIEEALGHAIPDQPDSDGVTRSKPTLEQEEERSDKLAKKTGLKWSTAMVFVCEQDCRGKDQGEIWSEEVVEMQLEHEE
jgi:pre-rRNA-processing protein TSR4